MPHFLNVLDLLNAKNWKSHHQDRGRKISNLNRISKQLFKAHYHDQHSKAVSHHFAIALKRHVRSTFKTRRRTPAFVEEIRRTLLFLHEYNLRVAKVKMTNKYPMSRHFNNLLVQYIELECEALYSQKGPVNRQAERDVTQRVLRLLHVILYDAIHCSEVDADLETTTKTCFKIMLKLVTGVRADCKCENRVVADLIMLLIDKININAEIDKLKGRNIPFYLDTHLIDPDVLQVRQNLAITGYESDGSNSDIEESVLSNQVDRLGFLNQRGPANGHKMKQELTSGKISTTKPTIQSKILGFPAWGESDSKSFFRQRNTTCNVNDENVLVVIDLSDDDDVFKPQEDAKPFPHKPMQLLTQEEIKTEKNDDARVPDYSNGNSNRHSDNNSETTNNNNNNANGTEGFDSTLSKDSSTETYFEGFRRNCINSNLLKSSIHKDVPKNGDTTVVFSASKVHSPVHTQRNKSIDEDLTTSCQIEKQQVDTNNEGDVEISNSPNHVTARKVIIQKEVVFQRVQSEKEFFQLAHNEESNTVSKMQNVVTEVRTTLQVAVAETKEDLAEQMDEENVYKSVDEVSVENVHIDEDALLASEPEDLDDVPKNSLKPTVDLPDVRDGQSLDDSEKSSQVVITLDLTDEDDETPTSSKTPTQNSEEQTIDLTDEIMIPQKAVENISPVDTSDVVEVEASNKSDNVEKIQEASDVQIPEERSVEILDECAIQFANEERQATVLERATAEDDQFIHSEVCVVHKAATHKEHLSYSFEERICCEVLDELIDEIVTTESFSGADCSADGSRVEATEEPEVELHWGQVFDEQIVMNQNPEERLETERETVPHEEDAISLAIPVVDNLVHGETEELSEQPAVEEHPLVAEPSVEEHLVLEPAIEELEAEEETVEQHYYNVTIGEPVVESVTVETSVEQHLIAESTIEEPVVESYTVEESVVEQPTVEQPTVEQGLIVESCIEEPAVESLTVEESIVGHSTIEQCQIVESTIEEPVVELLTVEESIVEQPTVEQRHTVESTIEEPVVELLTVEESIVEQPTVEQCQIVESTIEEPGVELLTVEESIVEQPTVEQPLIVESTIEESAVESLTVEESIIGQSTVEQRQILESTIEESVVESLTVEHSIVEQPTVEPHLTVESAIEELTVEKNVEQSVVEEYVEQFIVEEHVKNSLVEEPAVEEPTVEEPAVQEGSVESTIDGPADEESTVEHVGKLTVEEPAVEQPMVEHLFVESTIKGSTVEKHPVEHAEQHSDESIVEQLPVEEPIIPQFSVEEHLVESTTEEATIIESTVEEHVEQIAVEEPIAEQFLLEEHLIVEPTTIGELAIERPVVEKLSPEEFAIEEAAVAEPAVEKVVSDTVASQGTEHYEASRTSSVIEEEIVASKQGVESLHPTLAHHPDRADVEGVLESSSEELHGVKDVETSSLNIEHELSIGHEKCVEEVIDSRSRSLEQIPGIQIDVESTESKAGEVKLGSTSETETTILNLIEAECKKLHIDTSPTVGDKVVDGKTAEKFTTDNSSPAEKTSLGKDAEKAELPFSEQMKEYPSVVQQVLEPVHAVFDDNSHSLEECKKDNALLTLADVAATQKTLDVESNVENVFKQEQLTTPKRRTRYGNCPTKTLPHRNARDNNRYLSWTRQGKRTMQAKSPKCTKNSIKETEPHDFTAMKTIISPRANNVYNQKPMMETETISDDSNDSCDSSSMCIDEGVLHQGRTLEKEITEEEPCNLQPPPGNPCISIPEHVGVACDSSAKILEALEEFTDILQPSDSQSHQVDVKYGNEQFACIDYADAKKNERIYQVEANNEGFIEAGPGPFGKTDHSIKTILSKTPPLVKDNAPLVKDNVSLTIEAVVRGEVADAVVREVADAVLKVEDAVVREVADDCVPLNLCRSITSGPEQSGHKHFVSKAARKYYSQNSKRVPYVQLTRMAGEEDAELNGDFDFHEEVAAETEILHEVIMNSCEESREALDLSPLATSVNKHYEIPTQNVENSTQKTVLRKSTRIKLRHEHSTKPEFPEVIREEIPLPDNPVLITNPSIDFPDMGKNISGPSEAGGTCLSSESVKPQTSQKRTRSSEKQKKIGLEQTINILKERLEKPKEVLVDTESPLKPSEDVGGTDTRSRTRSKTGLFEKKTKLLCPEDSNTIATDTRSRRRRKIELIEVISSKYNWSEDSEASGSEIKNRGRRGASKELLEKDDQEETIKLQEETAKLQEETAKLQEAGKPVEVYGKSKVRSKSAEDKSDFKITEAKENTDAVKKKETKRRRSASCKFELEDVTSKAMSIESDIRSKDRIMTRRCSRSSAIDTVEKNDDNIDLKTRFKSKISEDKHSVVEKNVDEIDLKTRFKSQNIDDKHGCVENDDDVIDLKTRYKLKSNADKHDLENVDDIDLETRSKSKSNEDKNSGVEKEDDEVDLKTRYTSKINCDKSGAVEVTNAVEVTENRNKPPKTKVQQQKSRRNRKPKQESSDKKEHNEKSTIESQNKNEEKYVKASLKLKIIDDKDSGLEAINPTDITSKKKESLNKPAEKEQSRKNKKLKESADKKEQHEKLESPKKDEVKDVKTKSTNDDAKNTKKTKVVEVVTKEKESVAKVTEKQVSNEDKHSKNKSKIADKSLKNEEKIVGIANKKSNEAVRAKSPRRPNLKELYGFKPRRKSDGSQSVNEVSVIASHKKAENVDKVNINVEPVDLLHPDSVKECKLVAEVIKEKEKKSPEYSKKSENNRKETNDRKRQRSLSPSNSKHAEKKRRSNSENDRSKSLDKSHRQEDKEKRKRERSGSKSEKPLVLEVEPNGRRKKSVSSERRNESKFKGTSSERTNSERSEVEHKAEGAEEKLSTRSPSKSSERKSESKTLERKNESKTLERKSESRSLERKAESKSLERKSESKSKESKRNRSTSSESSEVKRKIEVVEEKRSPRSPFKSSERRSGSKSKDSKRSSSDRSTEKIEISTKHKTEAVQDKRSSRSRGSKNRSRPKEQEASRDDRKRDSKDKHKSSVLDKTKNDSSDKKKSNSQKPVTKHSVRVSSKNSERGKKKDAEERRKVLVLEEVRDSSRSPTIAEIQASLRNTKTRVEEQTESPQTVLDVPKIMTEEKGCIDASVKECEKPTDITPEAHTATVTEKIHDVPENEGKPNEAADEVLLGDATEHLQGLIIEPNPDEASSYTKETNEATASEVSDLLQSHHIEEAVIESVEDFIMADDHDTIVEMEPSQISDFVEHVEETVTESVEDFVMADDHHHLAIETLPPVTTSPDFAEESIESSGPKPTSTNAEKAEAKMPQTAVSAEPRNFDETTSESVSVDTTDRDAEQSIEEKQSLAIEDNDHTCVEKTVEQLSEEMQHLVVGDSEHTEKCVREQPVEETLEETQKHLVVEDIEHGRDEKIVEEQSIEEAQHLVAEDVEHRFDKKAVQDQSTDVTEDIDYRRGDKIIEEQPSIETQHLPAENIKHIHDEKAVKEQVSEEMQHLVVEDDHGTKTVEERSLVAEYMEHGSEKKIVEEQTTEETQHLVAEDIGRGLDEKIVEERSSEETRHLTAENIEHGHGEAVVEKQSSEETPHLTAENIEHGHGEKMVEKQSSEETKQLSVEVVEHDHDEKIVEEQPSGKTHHLVTEDVENGHGEKTVEEFPPTLVSQIPTVINETASENISDKDCEKCGKNAMENTEMPYLTPEISTSGVEQFSDSAEEIRSVATEGDNDDFSFSAETDGHSKDTAVEKSREAVSADANVLKSSFEVSGDGRQFAETELEEIEATTKTGEVEDIRDVATEEIEAVQCEVQIAQQPDSVQDAVRPEKAVEDISKERHVAIENIPESPVPKHKAEITETLLTHFESITPAGSVPNSPKPHEEEQLISVQKTISVVPQAEIHNKPEEQPVKETISPEVPLHESHKKRLFISEKESVPSDIPSVVHIETEELRLEEPLTCSTEKSPLVPEAQDIVKPLLHKRRYSNVSEPEPLEPEEREKRKRDVEDVGEAQAKRNKETGERYEIGSNFSDEETIMSLPDEVLSSATKQKANLYNSPQRLLEIFASHIDSSAAKILSPAQVEVECGFVEVGDKSSSSERFEPDPKLLEISSGIETAREMISTYSGSSTGTFYKQDSTVKNFVPEPDITLICPPKAMELNKVLHDVIVPFSEESTTAPLLETSRLLCAVSLQDISPSKLRMGSNEGFDSIPHSHITPNIPYEDVIDDACSKLASPNLDGSGDHTYTCSMGGPLLSGQGVTREEREILCQDEAPLPNTPVDPMMLPQVDIMDDDLGFSDPSNLIEGDQLNIDYYDLKCKKEKQDLETTIPLPTSEPAPTILDMHLLQPSEQFKANSIVYPREEPTSNFIDVKMANKYAEEELFKLTQNNPTPDLALPDNIIETQDHPPDISFVNFGDLSHHNVVVETEENYNNLETHHGNPNSFSPVVPEDIIETSQESLPAFSDTSYMMAKNYSSFIPHQKVVVENIEQCLYPKIKKDHMTPPKQMQDVSHKFPKSEKKVEKCLYPIINKEHTTPPKQMQNASHKFPKSEKKVVKPDTSNILDLQYLTQRKNVKTAVKAAPRRKAPAQQSPLKLPVPIKQPEILTFDPKPVEKSPRRKSQRDMNDILPASEFHSPESFKIRVKTNADLMMPTAASVTGSENSLAKFSPQVPKDETPVPKEKLLDDPKETPESKRTRVNTNADLISTAAPVSGSENSLAKLSPQAPKEEIPIPKEKLPVVAKDKPEPRRTRFDSAGKDYIMENILNVATKKSEEKKTDEKKFDSKKISEVNNKRKSDTAPNDGNNKRAKNEEVEDIFDKLKKAGPVNPHWAEKRTEEKKYPSAKDTGRVREQHGVHNHSRDRPTVPSRDKPYSQSAPNSRHHEGNHHMDMRSGSGGWRRDGHRDRGHYPNNSSYVSSQRHRRPPSPDHRRSQRGMPELKAIRSNHHTVAPQTSRRTDAIMKTAAAMDKSKSSKNTANTANPIEGDFSWIEKFSVIIGNDTSPPLFGSPGSSSTTP